MRSLLLTITLLLATACAPGGGPTTTASITLPACPVQLPADWEKAKTDARVEPGEALATGPDGEIVALRGREVLLLGADESINTVYTIPDPAREVVRFAALDHDRIVLGLDNPGVPGSKTHLKRIAVIDRGDGSIRTIADVTDADYQARRNLIDSVAIFGGKAYWITEGTTPLVDGTLRSYDFANATTTDVESGDMHDLRATATGLVWTSGSEERRRAVFLGLAPLPPALASIAGMNDDQTSLVRAGDAYAWITGLTAGGTGIARWSPETGLTRISTVRLFDGVFHTQPSLRLSGPYVVLSRADDDGSDLSELIDTRSGAVTLIDLNAVGATNDSIAYSVRGAYGKHVAVGSLRTEGLSPLACTSTGSDDAAQQACEMPTPGSWQEAFGSVARVETSGPTAVLAVGPGGDIAAGLGHHSRPLLLIDEDATVVRNTYAIADPDSERIRFASMGEHWIVLVVSLIQPEPEFTRIDVIDRSNGSVRTVMTRDRTKIRGGGDSLAVFGGTLYWTSGDGGDATTVHSYDLATGRTADVATSRSIADVRATATGIAWTEDHDARRVVVHDLAELPAPVRSAGADPHRDEVATDGDAYAWTTDAGIAHWSPGTGVKRINMIVHGGYDSGGIMVVGPYVLWPGHGSADTAILDTRSGAIASVEARVAATGGGTVALQIPENEHHSDQVGLVRLINLPPLTC